MIDRILVALLICSSTALAKPTAAPATAPADPADGLSLPAELVSQWKKAHEGAGCRCPGGLHRAFRAITEKPPAFSFFVSGNEPTPLRFTPRSSAPSRDDKDVRAS